MTNVSKRELSEKVSTEIGSKFLVVLSGLQKSDVANNFFFEFFTLSERIMFQKRLAIIFMLVEQTPILTIAEILKVSPATVNKLASIIDRGGYKSIIRILEKHKKVFWEEVAGIIFAGLPKQGKGRWDWIEKHKNLGSKKHYS